MTDPRPAGFTHLHVHTEYSRLDGLARLKDLCKAAAADGQTAIAMTDHGTLGGAYRFVKAAKDAGLKPILGCEVYMAIGSRHEKNTVEVTDDLTGEGKVKRYEHLTLLARTPQGWANLVAMSNKAQESYWYHPRIDYDLLAEHNEGLIVLTGCLAGPVAGQVAQGNLDAARANLRRLIDCVGAENVYVEIMDHGIDIERNNLGTMAALADEFGLPLVVTNDSHYVNDHDCDAHDAWLAVESTSGKPARLDDPNRFRFNGTGYHLRTEAEMRALFTGHRWQAACDQTMTIADRVADNVMPEFRLRIPAFPVPDSYTSAHDYFRALVYEGAAAKYGTGADRDLPAEVVERIEYEIGVIAGFGFEDYFLFVRDVIEWARSDRGMPTPERPEGEPGKKTPILVGPGRGSAAGAAVSYALNIVGLDPLQYGLLFERFLDPKRSGMPDIDVDFEARRREEVVAYLAARWGTDRVVRIGSFTVSQTRRAIKDAARLLDQTILGDKLSKLVPIAGDGKPYSFTKLDDTTDMAAEEFRRTAAAAPGAEAVLDLARAFEGVTNGEGIHACGILVSDEPLESLVPLRIDRRKGFAEAAVARWDGKDVDSFGLLKMDILSIRNLDVVAAAVRNIAATTGEVIDPDRLPDPNDSTDPRVAKAFAMLKAGKTAGIFQLESAGMTRLAEQVAPDNLYDLSALVALFRPGPLAEGMDQMYARRKHGREAVTYDGFTPDAAEQAVIASQLDETFGAVVYQEQLMSLGEVVAGFGAAEKNRLRKAFSKKVKAEMDAVKDLFLTGGQNEVRDEQGEVVKIAFRRETLETLWRTFDASAEYLFNKAHSAAYAQLAYVTAFLKANWPVEYGAALLAVTDGDDKRHAALAALAQDGITVAAPDINLSAATTMPDGTGSVRIGLSEIKEVGSAGAWVVAERERTGAFRSLADVVARVKVPDEHGNLTQRISLGAVEGLIEAGAFDSMGPRLGHAMVLRAVAGNAAQPVPDAEWGVLETSARQRHRLGVALGEHPLTRFRDDLRAWQVPDVTDEDLNALGGHPIPMQLLGERATGGQAVLTLGVLAGWSEKAYRGGRMANFTLEGSITSIEGVVWNETLVRLRSDDAVPAVGTIVAISGFAKKRVVVLSEPSEDGPGETMERVELTANRVWTIDVHDPATLAVPTPAHRLDLTSAIAAAREFAEATPKARAPRTTRSKPSPTVKPDAAAEQLDLFVEERVAGVPDAIWVRPGFGIAEARHLSGRTVATVLRATPGLAVGERPSGLALVEEAVFRVGGPENPVYVVFAGSEVAATGHLSAVTTYHWEPVTGAWEKAQQSSETAA